VFQRYREEGPGSIVSVVRNTGGAVALASLTTMIGYGSLLIAGNQAFVSFGLLAVLGEITCVIAAVVTLPAFLKWTDSWRNRRKSANA
jgi:predicted RND superfamily exporter protein